MTASTNRPFARHRSRTIRIDAVDGLGEPVELELQAEDWLHANTGRYRRVWFARKVGRLGWETSSSPRDALRRAAYVPNGKRPSWLTAAVRRAQALR